MTSQQHLDFLKIAIEKSQESSDLGGFPAGAVVVKDGKILATAGSSVEPSIFHADSKAINEAFEKHGPLTGATLYVGLESCLMCLGVAYWGGIREIYYAVPKWRVSIDYYESPQDTFLLSAAMNEPIAVHHVPELEDEAVAIIEAWEAKQG